MYRALPRGNKLCAQKEEERRQTLHRNKLREIRSTLDTTAPAVMKLDHLRNNAKREQLLDERFSEIDRSNRILLQKMGEIMNPQKSRSPVAVASVGKSLNTASRKKEFDRITAENLHILRRIQRAQPMYDHVKWQQHHRAHLARLKNCAEYPIVIESRTEGDSGSSRIPSAKKDSEYVKVPSVDPPTRSQEAFAGASMGAVHKEGRKFGNTYYLLELTSDGRSLTISAYDGETQETLELVVNEKNHRKFFRECHGDYGLLSKRIRVEGGRIWVDEVPTV